ncbi:MAG TPA: hypothetical protein V6D10_07385 [Trichocoleus sp.]|jgi:hypothetical protein
MIAIPDWLKTSPLVIHVPDRTIFEPQRRVVFRNGSPHLLDCCNQAYPLGHCDELRLDYLKGVALWITDNQPLTVFRLTAAGDEIAVTDGHRKAIVRIPAPKPKSEERQAAEFMADLFDGQIITEVAPCLS